MASIIKPYGIHTIIKVPFGNFKLISNIILKPYVYVNIHFVFGT